MKAREKKKSDSKAKGIYQHRQWNEACASTKNMIGTLHKTLLVSLFFLLFCPGFSEAQVPEAHRSCALCHVEEGSPALKAGINETCIGCHPNRPERDHPVGGVVKDVPEKLPVDQENKITCITCHEPHGKETEEKLLRMEFNSLCIVCHKI